MLSLYVFFPISFEKTPIYCQSLARASKWQEYVWLDVTLSFFFHSKIEQTIGDGDSKHGTNRDSSSQSELNKSEEHETGRGMSLHWTEIEYIAVLSFYEDILKLKIIDHQVEMSLFSSIESISPIDLQCLYRKW